MLLFITKRFRSALNWLLNLTEDKLSKAFKNKSKLHVKRGRTTSIGLDLDVECCVTEETLMVYFAHIL